MSTPDLAHFIGRQERCTDVADPVRISGLKALLDEADAGDNASLMPPLGHWLHFRPMVRQSLIDTDGHPRRTESGLLPPSDLARRMWAGSRVEFPRQVRLGTPMEQLSTLASATFKTGRSGRMLFVTVRREIRDNLNSEPAIIEEQDIVYRAAPSRAVPAERTIMRSASKDGAYVIRPDPVLLFRYSALTFNGHRIHYDRDYARRVEGYDGLVVQGPLVATLLLSHLQRQRPGVVLSHFSCRATAATFEGEPLELALNDVDDGFSLIANGPRGAVMAAHARSVQT